MRNKIYTIIALTLVLCMLFTACSTPGNKETKGTEADKTTGTQTDGTGATDGTTEAESIYPDYLNMDSARPIVKEGEEITLTVALQRSPNAVSSLDDLWFLKFIEEKLNINLEIEVLTSTNVNERKSLMLAGDDMPDLMIQAGITGADVIKYGVEGDQILALSDYMSEELTPNMLALFEKLSAYATDYTYPDGKIYTLPGYTDMDKPGFGNTVAMTDFFVDVNYMKAAGYTEVPTTLDGFIDMLRAFKKLDPAAMGVDEIWPLSGVAKSYMDRQFFMNALGWAAITSVDLTYPIWDAAEDKLIIPCMDEKFAELVKIYHTLYTEGLIHPDYFSLEKKAARAMAAEGKMAVISDTAPYLWTPERYDEYVCATPLTSEWSQTAIATMTSTYNAGGIYVSANTEYPEVCMRLLDYLCSDEGAVYSRYGCPAGSEDTLGMISGFRLNEAGTDIEYEDIISGKAEYKTAYDYQSNVISLYHQNAHKIGDINLIAQKMLGVENPTYAPLDTSDPDGNFRAQWVEASKKAELVHKVTLSPLNFLTGEKMEDYSDLRTVMEAYVDAEFAKFVVGQRDLSELPDYFKELNEMGGDDYYKLVMEAYKDYVHPEN